MIDVFFPLDTHVFLDTNIIVKLRSHFSLFSRDSFTPLM